MTNICSVEASNIPKVVETIFDVKKLSKDIKINSDDLREVMLLFMQKLSTQDFLYSLITMETEYEKRKYGYDDKAA